MPSELPFPGDRICLVLLTGIGDVVHGLPVAEALKEDDPRRRVLWVAEPAPAEVLRAHPAVDRIIPFHKERGVRGVLGLWREFRGAPADITLNLQRYFKSIFPTLLSRAPHRIGLDPAKVRDGVALSCNHHLPPGPWRHTQDLFLEFLDYLGVPRGEPRWRITLTRDERREQRRFFGELPPGPVAAVVLATANPKKDWPRERYVPLVERLEREMGFTVLLVGGPGEREQAAAAFVRSRARTRPIPALGGGVRRLIWLLEGSDLVVCPDTGPLHIAHALGVPVVGLFGHTNPWRVGPYRRFRDLVVDRYTDPGEAPDPARTEPRHGRMERITVDDVLEKVRLAVDRYLPRRRGAGR